MLYLRALRLFQSEVLSPGWELSVLTWTWYIICTFSEFDITAKQSLVVIESLDL